MFFSFFKKKNTNPVSSIYKCNKVHYLTVIKGYEIAEIDSSLFDLEKRSGEESYKALLVSMQPIFKEFQKNGFLDTTSGSDEEIKLKQDCISKFIDENGPYINVIKKKNIYYVATNGRHRMYVARKYNLDILVHVLEEEI